jgi:hypothetical protein
MRKITVRKADKLTPHRLQASVVAQVRCQVRHFG